MISPRIALAAGFAGAAGAALMLAGRIDGSVVTVLALVLAARAAALASSPERPLAQRALGKQIDVVPVWVGIAIVGAVRAGSAELADVRGANAIAGIALARGSLLLVIAAWLAVVAGALALLSPMFGGSSFGGTVVGDGPQARLELIAVALQVGLLVTLFAGPQVRVAGDAIPWVVGLAAAAAGLWLGRRFARDERLARAAIALAALAVACALLAEQP